MRTLDFSVCKDFALEIVGLENALLRSLVSRMLSLPCSAGVDRPVLRDDKLFVLPHLARCKPPLLPLTPIAAGKGTNALAGSAKWLVPLA